MFSFYKKLTFGQKLYLSISLGLFFGLFFGNECAVLEKLNQFFVKFFQIAIIPYLVLTIIQAVGSIDSKYAKHIGMCIVKTALFLWALSIIFIVFFYFALPDIPYIGFYRLESLAIKIEKTDMLNFFVPSNPFFSISQGHIPAIVIFCLLVGIVLINEKNKKSFLVNIEFMSHLMKKVNDLLMSLLPLGILVMSTYMFGTVNVDILKGIMLYLILSIIYLIVMSLLVLPGIIFCTNDISIKRLINLIFPSSLIAFATGNVFLALPVIYDSLYKFDEEIANKYNYNKEILDKRRNYINIIVPLAWAFPAAYKFLIIFFILFEKWYYGTPVGLLAQISYYIAGIPILFGNTSVAVPYLIQITNLPEYTYNYFALISNIMVYPNNACGAVFIITFTVLCCIFINKELIIKHKKLFILLPVSAVVFMTASIAVKEMITPFMAKKNLDKNLSNMELQSQNQTYVKKIEFEIISLDESGLKPNIDVCENLLDEIINTKKMKVAFRPDKWPFSFLDHEGELIGYDIDNIFDMADNLGCKKIEFYPINNIDDFKKLLKSGYSIDIAIGGFWSWSTKTNMSYSTPYMMMHISAVIHSKDKQLFPDFKSVIKNENITFGVLKGNDLQETLSLFVNPNRITLLESESDFYKKKLTDVFITDAESACATNMIYPEYMVLPLRDSSNIHGFFAYPLPSGKPAYSIQEFVTSWITGNKMDGTLDDRYKYWIQGIVPSTLNKERWSILAWLNRGLKNEIKDQIIDMISSSENELNKEYSLSVDSGNSKK